MGLPVNQKIGRSIRSAARITRKKWRKRKKQRRRRHEHMKAVRRIIGGGGSWIGGGKPFDNDFKIMHLTTLLSIAFP